MTAPVQVTHLSRLARVLQHQGALIARTAAALFR